MPTWNGGSLVCCWPLHSFLWAYLPGRPQEYCRYKGLLFPSLLLNHIQKAMLGHIVVKLQHFWKCCSLWIRFVFLIMPNINQSRSKRNWSSSSQVQWNQRNTKDREVVFSVSYYPCSCCYTIQVEHKCVASQIFPYRHTQKKIKQQHLNSTHLMAAFRFAL